jgi:hypothetical protein
VHQILECLDSCSIVKSFFYVVLCSDSLLLFFYVAGCQGEIAEDWRRLFVYAIGIVVGEFYTSFFTSFSTNTYRDHPLTAVVLLHRDFGSLTVVVSCSRPWISLVILLPRRCPLFFHSFGSLV